MLLNYGLDQVVDSTELCARLNGALMNIDSPIIITPSIIMIPTVTMTPTIIMTHEVWFHSIKDITIVWSYALLTILIVNTELEHYRIIVNVTFVY